MDGKIFSAIKKHNKSNGIGFVSVPLNIKIGVFLVKKELFFRISSYAFRSINNLID